MLPTLSRLLVCSAVVAAAITSAPASHAAAAPTPCAAMGTAIKVGAIKVPACSAFHKGSIAIKFPVDTATTAYGMVYERSTGMFGMPAADRNSSAVFVDRNSKETTATGALVPKSLQGARSLVQYIFKATKQRGRIKTLAPVLFVPLGTMVKPFAGLEFRGTVASMGAPDNIDPNAWVRWDMNSHIANGKLGGDFTNLNKSVKTGMMFEPPSPCAYSLLAPLNGDWFSKVLGTSPRIHLEWNPAMHTAGDSEFVMFMGSGVSYMTAGPRVHDLLKSNLDPQGYREFTIHGNPMGAPYKFQGMFGPNQPGPLCNVPPSAHK
ncbi:MAG: hypothetical protein WCJ22_00875 [Actinomycetes bacterium]